MHRRPFVAFFALSMTSFACTALLALGACTSDDNTLPGTFHPLADATTDSLPTTFDAHHDQATHDAADANLDADAAPVNLWETGAAVSCGDGGAAPDSAVTTCGPAQATDCCESAVVPGGTFLRDYDGVTLTSNQWPATLSTFTLDAYEVTVARFRAFVAAGGGTQAHPPPPGSGANAHVPASGWDPAWNGLLPLDTATLELLVKTCDGAEHVWTDAPGANETKPMNCLSWYVAFAFCSWDDGRLPTRAEHGYAAAGGSEARYAPWSNPSTSTTVDHTYASYGCYEGSTLPSDPSIDGGACTGGSLLSVGSFPNGTSKWSQSDLAGSLWEWALDYDLALQVPCQDCASLDAGTNPPVRVLQGGAFTSGASGMSTWSAISSAPGTSLDTYGVRCAR